MEKAGGARRKGEVGGGGVGVKEIAGIKKKINNNGCKNRFERWIKEERQP